MSPIRLPDRCPVPFLSQATTIGLQPSWIIHVRRSIGVISYRAQPEHVDKSTHIANYTLIFSIGFVHILLARSFIRFHSR